MKIVLQDRESLKELSPCLVQFFKGQLFTQGIIGVTDRSVYFYDDNQPNSLEGGEAYYKVEHLVRFEDIDNIIFGKTKKNRETRALKYFVLCNALDEEKNTTVYYTKKEKKRIILILKILKREGIKFKRKNIKLVPVFNVPRSVYEKPKY